ncbi:MAG: hypothetical protein QMD95_02050 [Candidatus Hodarchaeaceae archaeon]|nr:hypothetical protein [Candidatus Hodarchaeaceae archaeon]
MLGTFDSRNLKKSLANLCIFLLVLGVIFSPFVFMILWREHQINNPAQLINRGHPKILEMTAEFENMVPENATTEETLYLLERYVYRKIPYDYAFSIFPPPLQTIDDIMVRMTATCWGRALVGYCILKNMGHDVYVVGTYAGNHHFWLRVYESESYRETFLVGGRREPWVMFNELNVYWSSPLDELYKTFFEGFEVGFIGMVEELALGSFYCGIPIVASAIYILVSKRNRKFITYVGAVTGALIVAVASGCIGVVNARLMLLPIIVAGGVYLRILNRKTRKLKG